MSDSGAILKKGPFRNADGSVSLKKILGAVGVVMFYAICIFGIIKDPQTETILGVLERLGWFSAGLLGLKIGTGAVEAYRSKS